MDRVEIWTDGSCYPNPGPGGWGSVIVRDGREEELMGTHTDMPKTTNNRMELLGVIETLNSIRSATVTVFSDSTYVTKLWGLRPGFRSDKPNYDLWMLLRDAIKRHDTVNFNWVKGHSGVELNEKADRLALQARQNGIEIRELLSTQN